ncbi:MAG TPA: Asp-tRNA(Asn)/Glu-tRNA(Gln) amidotransferase subunit GatA [Longimicrobiaceae bacterium]|nr:Asp-tRNA(Asn)/Glu-tRNA(Gln) amidotransferase subunit GatA [Longimicrobiaceae bacterium]
MQPIASLARSLHSGAIAPDDILREAALALAVADSGPDPIHPFIQSNLTERSFIRATGALAGIPIAVKDNIATVDFPTTCGSRILEGYTSPFDATAVKRLRAAGAVIVGKTNLDEFGMGSSTEYSVFGVTRNPHDRSRVPGGSSGGSAAAVAAGIVPAALGSETGGSVRQPAAFCGVVGLRPTYGRVSRSGLIAFASSLDQVGVLARTVADAALVQSVVAGHDQRDSTSSRRQLPEFDGDGDLDGTVIGVPGEYFPDHLDPGVRSLCRAALRRMEACGATIREVSLPHTRLAITAYHVIAGAEASSNLARFDGVRYGASAIDPPTPGDLYELTRARFGPEVKRRILLGTHLLSHGHGSAHYQRAQKARALVSLDFDYVFASGVDAIFTPTTPAPAFRIGEHIGDPASMYGSDEFTVPASLAGVPALSLPIGFRDGLPVGGQLICGRWEEARLMRIAAGLETALL